MLKKRTVMPLPLLMLVLACNASASSIRYCNAQNTTSLLMDFSKHRVVITDAGQGDQIFPIEPCGTSIRNCFMGEISFVNPYKVSLSQNPNVISADSQGTNANKITLQGAGTFVSYEIARSETFPHALFLADRMGKGERFTLCS